MRVQLPKFMIKFAGNAYFHKYPMFFVYKPDIHRVRGPQVRQILNTVEPGDVLYRRHDGYLNTICTPGYYGHVGLYVGGDQVVHALGKGIIEEDIINFCRADAVGVSEVVGASEEQISDAIDFAKSQIGKEYDFTFTAGDDVYNCTELIDAAYMLRFVNDYEMVLGNRVLTPDGMYLSRWSRIKYDTVEGNKLALVKSRRV